MVWLRFVWALGNWNSSKLLTQNNRYSMYVCSAHFVSLRIHHRCEFRNEKSKIKRKMKTQIYLFTLDGKFQFVQYVNERRWRRRRQRWNQPRELSARTNAIRTHSELFISFSSSHCRLYHVVSCRRMDRKRHKENIQIFWRKANAANEMNGFNDNGTLISDVFGSDFRIRDGIISISIAKIGGKYSSVFQLEIS